MRPQLLAQEAAGRQLSRYTDPGQASTGLGIGVRGELASLEYSSSSSSLLRLWDLGHLVEVVVLPLRAGTARGCFDRARHQFFAHGAKAGKAPVISTAPRAVARQARPTSPTHAARPQFFTYFCHSTLVEKTKNNLQCVHL